MSNVTSLPRILISFQQGAKNSCSNIEGWLGDLGGASLGSLIKLFRTEDVIHRIASDYAGGMQEKNSCPA